MHFSNSFLLTIIGVVAASPTPGGKRLSKRQTGKLPSSYVAFGDSYSAGIGAGGILQGSRDGQDVPCARTDGSYPHQLVNNLIPIFDPPITGWADFYSCSGAVLDDIDLQLNAVGSRTFDLATVSIIGNDFSFGNVAKKCLYNAEYGVSETKARNDCDVALAEVDNKLLRSIKDSTLWDGMRDKLKRIYDKVLAGDGLLIVTGYPTFFSAEANPNDLCENLRTNWYSEYTNVKWESRIRQRINGFVRQVNDRIVSEVIMPLQEQVGDNIDFIDQDALGIWDHHRFCEWDSDRNGPIDPVSPNVWLNELNTPPLWSDHRSWTPLDAPSQSPWGFTNALKPSLYQQASTLHPKAKAYEALSNLLYWKILQMTAGDFSSTKLKSRGIPGPVENDQFIWGPATFEMGFSPGGGMTCFRVPENCGVLTPHDNTMPQAYCSDGVRDLSVC